MDFKQAKIKFRDAKLKLFLSALQTGYYKRARNISRKYGLDKKLVSSAAVKEYKSVLSHKKYLWALQIAEYFKILNGKELKSLATKYYNNSMRKGAEEGAIEVAKRYNFGEKKISAAAKKLVDYLTASGLDKDAKEVAERWGLDANSKIRSKIKPGFIKSWKPNTSGNETHVIHEYRGKSNDD